MPPQRLAALVEVDRLVERHSPLSSRRTTSSSARKASSKLIAAMSAAWSLHRAHALTARAHRVKLRSCKEGGTIDEVDRRLRRPQGWRSARSTRCGCAGPGPTSTARRWATCSRPDFRPAPAIAFYLLYIAALVWFAVRPGHDTAGSARRRSTARCSGAICYATYDLTNQATMKVWPVHVTLIDIAWGAFASAVAAAVGCWAAARFG